MTMQFRYAGTQATAIFAALILAVTGLGASVRASPAVSEETESAALIPMDDSASDSYFSYYAAHNAAPRAPSAIHMDGKNASRTQHDRQAKDVDGISSICLDKDSAWAEWTFSVPETGAYSIHLAYYPLKGSGQDMELSVYVDGRLPFLEADAVTLPRIWTDKADENGVTIQRDGTGNDIKPQQVEKPRWTTSWLKNSLGLYEEPYLFYLEKGEHTVRLTAKREALAVGGLDFAAVEKVPDYAAYIAGHPGARVQNRIYKIEAENAVEKNSAMPSPTYDSANAGMSPESDPRHIRLTAVGADTWYQNGQMLTWKAPEDMEAGLYQLQFRAKQSVNPGIAVYRTLYVNGKVPFAQAKSIAFPYSTNWYIKTLGDETPYVVYMEPGDTLSLEATTGGTAEILRTVNQAVLDINSIYRQIVTITGVNPDAYRDYSLEKELPNLMRDLTGMRRRVVDISALIKELMGKATSQTAILDQLAVMLQSFVGQPNSIPEHVAALKSSIDGMASILLTFNEQPLSLDVIYVKAENTPSPRANAGWFEELVYGVKRLLYSFSGDYDSLRQEGGYDKTISVWAVAGRDQAQIISRLIDDRFSSREKIGVKLSLIASEEVLVQSLLADRGPDATLMLQPETPVNLALRGAVVNLSNGSYDLTPSFVNEFPEAAWAPLTYKNGIYGMPEQMDFNVLFYRSDILKELGIAVPDTWEAFYDAVRILHNKRYMVGLQEIGSADTGLSAEPGISASIPIFDAFLFQNGGGYFNEDQTRTLFDTPAAYDAFDEWVALYRDYGFERSFEFSNVMRSGEMPLGIAQYNRNYIKIAATAPELRGLWGIAPLPGTPQADGTVNRAVSAEIRGCVLHTIAVQRGVDQEAFRFLTWWAGSEAQTAFSQSMEAALGISGRQALANQKAWGNLGWSTEEKAVIQEELKWVKGIPQVPGSYILKRALSNAMRQSATEFEESRRMLTVQNQFINDELTRKRREFER